LPAALRPLVDELAQTIVASAWSGYAMEAVDYTDAVAAMKKNPLWGVDLKNVLSWGKREAMQVAAQDMASIEGEVRGFLEAAVTQGMGLKDFEARLGEALQTRGLATPDPWHAETIFRTNVLGAYSGGQWARAQELAASGEIVAAMYVAVRDDRTRETHLAMDGFWARLDDEVWTRWWPPAGWNCRCTIILLTQADVDRLGGWAATPAAPAVSPDPGFEGNPGTGLWAVIGKHMA
jgi:SPP1 gp7 family putative phage head morphogenesis protein